MDDDNEVGDGWAEVLRRIGHSLRTPLNSITGAWQMLSGTDLDPDQREHMATIGSASDALLAAINDLLDIAEIESSGLQLQQIPFRLPDAIREGARGLRPLATDRGIELTLHGLSTLPTDVVGDPARIRQVVARLVDNAVKYTHHGRVQVGAELVAHDAREVTVRIAVRDSGVGIASDDLERIFEPFTRGPSNAPGLSSGLGLSISRTAVRAMGGDITVHSEPGRGSVFSFVITLPRQVAPSGDAEVTPPDTTWVIVLGDRPESNSVLSSALRNGGLEPSEFSSLPLASASVALADDPEDTPLAVVVAPTEAPFEFAQRVLDDRHLSRAPLILVTPQGERGDAAECGRLGIEGYLPQPVSPVDLIEAVTVVAAGSDSHPLVTRHWLRERRNRLDVLVVDDSPTGRALVIRALDQLGHETTGAADGREAVERAGEKDFDVILMDMEMPDMDGIAATRQIRSTGSTVPIVGLSAHAFSADRQACLDAGMNEHLTKPFKLETLQMMMESLARSH